MDAIDLESPTRASDSEFSYGSPTHPEIDPDGSNSQIDPDGYDVTEVNEHEFRVRVRIRGRR